MTKQLLSANFSTENPTIISNFEYWSLSLITYIKGHFIIPFPANVLIMEKPGSWFLLAKCVKNNCGRVTF